LQLGQGGQLVVQQMPQTQTFQIPGQGGQMQQVLNSVSYGNLYVVALIIY